MADPKKKDSKKAGPPAESPHKLPATIIIVVVVALLVLGYISSLLGFASVNDLGNALLLFIANIIEPLSFISVFISLLFVMGLIYTAFLSSELKKEAKAKLEEKPVHTDPSPIGHPNEKWLKVQNHINSGNPSDWRLAIIEADIMLEEMLQKMGYKGEGIGEMLKSVEKSDFSTLDDAWEAHKVRNNIAHQGGDYMLSVAEAKRTIGSYQKVFEEFFYI